MTRRRPVTATYRLQLHRRFALRDASRVVDYLAELGISHVYSSPLLQARHGSTHGYDVTDPRRLNPELGREATLRALVARLRARRMGLVLDIVPNHVATSAENPAWDDTLRRGVRSPYARWFDVAWDEGRHRTGAGRTGHRPCIVLPVLGRPLAEVLAGGELALALSRGELRLRYGTLTLPLDPETLPLTLRGRQRSRHHLDTFTRGRGGADRLAALLDQQHYRLAYWREADSVNYRRFFDINELAAVRQEDPSVFAETHTKILAWIAAGWIDGLRIDHVDGLRDPAGYLTALRGAIAARTAGHGPARVWVEKIVAAGEVLRSDWPVQGTSGYEFMNVVDGIFVAPRGFADIERWYRRRIARSGRDFDDIAARAKRAALGAALRPDLDRLVNMTAGLGDASVRNAPRASLRTAWTDVTTALPVYRTYVTPERPRGTREDRRLIEEALGAARHRRSSDRRASARVRAIVTGTGRAHVSVVERWQQLCGPAAAKGVEDTALYRYVPLVSLNEVGGEPTRALARSVELLHADNAARRASWPGAMLAATTHDTKRSADLRARLHALSEIAAEWQATVERWQAWNRPHRTRGSRAFQPDATSEYLLYQTLVGIWPLPRGGAARGGMPSRSTLVSLHARVSSYMLKAVREAKQHTSWIESDARFEGALQRFIDRLLLSERVDCRRFRADLAALVARVARPGLWTALSRTLLQLTAPGFPDVYQGDELWTFSLVDPDNRRPVDFALRRRLLASIARRPTARFLEELLTRPEDGRIKLYLMRTVLRARRRDPELFEQGSYVPLPVRGPGATHVVAFLRSTSRSEALVVVPRLVLSLTGDDRPPLGPEVWAGTMIELPSRSRDSYRSPLTGESLAVDGRRRLPVAELLRRLPVALWVARQR